MQLLRTRAIEAYRQRYERKHGKLTPITSVLKFEDWQAIGTTGQGMILAAEPAPGDIEFRLLTYGTGLQAAKKL